MRIPAVCCAILLSILIGIWARRWYGNIAGWGAALAQLTAINVLIFARKAEVDMLLCLLTTTALFLVAHQPLEEDKRKSFLRWTGFWALLSLAWMAKFHYGPSMVIAPTIAYFILRGAYRHFWKLCNPVGLALFAAAVFVWPWLLLQQVPDALELWREETVGRAIGELGHKSVFFYIYPLLWLTLPWTPFALAAALPSVRRTLGNKPTNESTWLARIRSGDPREQFLWTWFFTVLAIVTASANKHQHYLMAALPMVSLLVGQRVSKLTEWVCEGRRLVTLSWAISLTVVCLGTAIFAPVMIDRLKPDLPILPISMMTLILGGGCTMILWLLYARKPLSAICTSMSVFLGCFIALNGWILRQGDHRQPFTVFAQEIRATYPADEEIIAYGLGYHSMLFYLEPPFRRAESLRDLSNRLAREKSLLVLVTDPDLEDLSSLGRSRTIKTLDFSETGESLTRSPMHLVQLSQENNAISSREGPEATGIPRSAVIPDKDSASR